MTEHKIDAGMTVEAINEMADTLEHYAKDLRRIAKRMDETNNLSYAGEAMQTVKNCFANVRIDLLVVRPMREYEKITQK